MRKAMKNKNCICNSSWEIELPFAWNVRHDKICATIATILSILHYLWPRFKITARFQMGKNIIKKIDGIENVARIQIIKIISRDTPRIQSLFGLKRARKTRRVVWEKGRGKVCLTVSLNLIEFVIACARERKSARALCVSMSILCWCRVRFANVIVFLHRCVELCGEIKFTNEFVWHRILAGAHVDFENFTEFNKQTKTWKCRIDMQCIAIRACGFKVQIKCSARFISHSIPSPPPSSCSTTKHFWQATVSWIKHKFQFNPLVH